MMTTAFDRVGRAARLGAAIVAVTLLCNVAKAEQSELDDRWEAGLRSAFLGEREVVIDEQVVQVRAPRKTDEPTQVSVGVRVDAPGVSRLHMFIDTNPEPLVGVFKPEKALAAIDLGLRVRLDRSTMFRAVAEFEDGRLLMAAKHITTLGGGCSAPPVTGVSKALETMGRMKLRELHRDDPGASGLTELLISHPNLNGMQRDLANGGFYPARYLRHLTVTFNEQPLLSADLGISVSSDPVIRFAMPSTDGTLSVLADDSKGSAFSRSFSIKAGKPAGAVDNATADTTAMDPEQ
jgi:sulfur-oxidizing protein SoxY